MLFTFTSVILPSDLVNINLSPTFGATGGGRPVDFNPLPLTSQSQT